MKEYEIDPDFTGSIFEQLGFAPQLCPDCHAHMKTTQYGTLICLNACRIRFIRRIVNDLDAQIAAKRQEESP